MGDANSLSINELVLSLAITMPENSDMKDSPNTATPGDSFSMANSSTGIFD